MKHEIRRVREQFLKNKIIHKYNKTQVNLFGYKKTRIRYRRNAKWVEFMQLNQKKKSIKKSGLAVLK